MGDKVCAFYKQVVHDVSVMTSCRLTSYVRLPFCKIKDGGHIGLGANRNIVFLVAYIIMFPKMYSFHTLQENPTTVKIRTQ